jgi:precorrin-6B methylase 2
MPGALRSGRGLTWVIVALWSLACANDWAGAEEFDLIAEKLQLAPGMDVADVGAGDGSWSVQIARVVGDQGHVWATEITREDVDEIEDRIEKEALINVSPILGGQDETGLPPGCCDAVLLRLVYHHFVEPESMKESLLESLRPGGILVVIEVRPENSWPDLDDVPDRGGHGIEPDALRSELSAAGFEFLELQDDWNGDTLRYCSVFRRRS